MKGLRRLLAMIAVVVAALAIATAASKAHSPANADPPSVINVHIGDQIWICQLRGGTGQDCVLMNTAHLHS